LKTKLEQLPERQREVIHLRYFQNLKNEEIADIINVNYQSVSNLLHRAVKNLKKQLIAKRSTFLFL
jgi:RNA polymerase sigma factor (sigma-70 family)